MPEAGTLVSYSASLRWFVSNSALVTQGRGTPSSLGSIVMDPQVDIVFILPALSLKTLHA